MSETIRTSSPGTTKCTMQLVNIEGCWYPQTTFEGEGVDWFKITWDVDELNSHIENLQSIARLAQRNNELEGNL